MTITPRTFPPGWLRLLLLLSGIALAVAVVRIVEMSRIMAVAGGGMRWAPVLTLESVLWLSWCLWAFLVILLVRKAIDHTRGTRSNPLLLIALAVAPVFLIPGLVGPVHWAVFPGNSVAGSIVHVATHNALTNLLLGAVMTGVVHGYLSLQYARRLEVTAARLNAQLADAQLDTLRSQLDPHFLFNALNSIAVLARRGLTGEVELMVTRLAGLLRHSLEQSRAQLVPLRVEIAALEFYLEIEKVRHGSRLEVSLAIPETLLERVVPSFVLQPLVENSIRHGFGDGRRPLHVSVTVHEEGGKVLLQVADDGVGVRDGTGAEGIGLGNTRARLTALYGTEASIALESQAGEGTRVVIQIPEPPEQHRSHG